MGSFVKLVNVFIHNLWIILISHYIFCGNLVVRDPPKSMKIYHEFHLDTIYGRTTTLTFLNLTLSL